MSFVSQNKGRMQFISPFMRPSNHKESLDGVLYVHCFGGFRIDHRGWTGKDRCIFGIQWNELKIQKEIRSTNEWIFISYQMAEVNIDEVIYIPLGKNGFRDSWIDPLQVALAWWNAWILNEVKAVHIITIRWLPINMNRNYERCSEVTVRFFNGWFLKASSF